MNNPAYISELSDEWGNRRIFVNKLFEHLIHRRRVSEKYHLRTRDNRLYFYRWLFKEYHYLLNDSHCWPDFVKQECNEISNNQQANCGPVSVLMKICMENFFRVDEICNEEKYYSFLYGFYKEWIIGHRVCTDFIPKYILPYLNSASGSLQPLTRFWELFYYDNEYYQKHYNILQNSGRIAFIVEIINNYFQDKQYKPVIPKPFYRELCQFAEHNKIRNLTLQETCDEISQVNYSFNDESLEEVSTVLKSKYNTEKKGYISIYSKVESCRNELFYDLFKKPRLYIITSSNSVTGLGENAKMMKRAFNAISINPVVLNEDLALVEPVPVQSGGSSYQFPLNRYIFIYTTTPDAIPEVDYLARGVHGLDCIRIGLLLWEVSQIPHSHRLTMDILDEIWCPTSYVTHIYKDYFPGKTITVCKGLNYPDDIKDDYLSELGYNKSDFVFLTYFDFGSCIERKNPIAAVKAFKEAFAQNNNVKMLIKTQNVDPDHWGNRYNRWAELKQAVADDSRITLLETKLEFNDLLRLVKSCNCFVSLHRSEGFGYGLAQALWYGKPVILTGYSGPVDYCTPDVTIHVSYSLVRVEKGEFLHDTENGMWAEPDVLDASVKMREVYENYEASCKNAKVGMERIRRNYSVKSFSLTLQERIDYCIKTYTS